MKWQQTLVGGVGLGLTLTLTELRECLQARSVQRLAQLGTLQPLLQQRLHCHRTGGVHGRLQIGGLRVVALLETEAPAGVHFPGGEELFEAWGWGLAVKALQNLKRRAGFEFGGGVAVVVVLEPKPSTLFELL